MKTELVTTDAGLTQLEPEWNELVTSSDQDSPFLHWPWCWTWWRHYGAAGRLAIILARHHGQLVGLAPLYVHGGRTGRTLRLLGSGEVWSEYLGFILRRGFEGQGLTALLGRLSDERRLRRCLLQLWAVPQSGVFARTLGECLAVGGKASRVEPAGSCWHIKLADSWDRFLKGLSRNRREKIRRARRTVQKHRLVYQRVQTAEQLKGCWPELVELHQARWRAAGEPGCFASQRFASFHREMAQTMLDRGMLWLNTLRHEGRAVAASYGFRYRGVVYYYQGGSDPRWQRRRVGHALRVCELEQAIQSGDRLYDLLGGDMEYKRQWATGRTPMVQFSVALGGWLSPLRLYIDRAGGWAKLSARTLVPGAVWQTARRWKHRLATPGP